MSEGCYVARLEIFKSRSCIPHSSRSARYLTGLALLRAAGDAASARVGGQVALKLHPLYPNGEDGDFTLCQH